MAEGSSVSAHVIKLHGYVQRLEALGVPFPAELGTDIILNSLPTSFAGFVMNYNMHGMNKTLGELFAMLKVAEKDIQKDANHVMLVKKTTHFKKKAGKKKKKGSSKAAGEARTPGKGKDPKSNPKLDAECFFCKEKGHWKRNCPKYLAEKKKTGTSSSGIFDIHVIDVFLSGPKSNSWVFDTGSVANICNSMQELRRTRMLEKNEVTMRVGNGTAVAVIAVGTMPLHLPSELILELSNCYFVLALCKNIISGYCILQDGYSFKSENNGCSIYMNNVFYCHAPIRNGLFYIE